jgi:hypothetical protein
MNARERIIERQKMLRDQFTKLVETAPESAWTHGVYEDGWNELQLLCHIANMIAPAGFTLQMSKLPAGSGIGGQFDQDAFNRDQVKLREGKSPSELLAESQMNLQRDIQAVEAASDEDLERHRTAPWGTEGTVAEIIMSSLDFHLGQHVNDLQAALRP